MLEAFELPALVHLSPAESAEVRKLTSENRVKWMEEALAKCQSSQKTLQVHFDNLQGSSEILGQILAEISGSSQSLVHKVACDVLSFTETLPETIKLGKFLPGSTEIIESMIGKYKDVVGEHSRWGITGAVLSMAAFVGEMTPQIILEALKTTRVK